MRAIDATDLMTPDVLTVSEDLPVADLAAFLRQHKITGAPVVDLDGKPCGVVSLIDLAAAVEVRSAARLSAFSDFYSLSWEESLDEIDVDSIQLEDDELRVRDIMTESVYSVPETATVSEIAEKMLHAHVHRLLVVREEQIVGIISTSDLLGLLLDE